MKTLCSLFCSLFLVAGGPTWGQHSVTEFRTAEHEDFVSTSKTISNYDNKGNRIELTVYNWNRNTDTYEYRTKENWAYDEDRLTYFSRAGHNSNEWNYIIEYFIEYTEEGHIQSQTSIPHYSVLPAVNTTFANNYSSDLSWPQQLNDYDYYAEFRVDQVVRNINGAKYLEIFIGGNQFPSISRESILDEDGRLISQVEIYDEVGYGTSKQIKYNDKGDIIKWELLKRNSFQDPWELDTKLAYEYIYTNELITEQKRSLNFYNDGYSYYSSDHLINHKYNCDGSLKKSEGWNQYADDRYDFSSRYEYSDIINCTLSENDIEQLSINGLSIYPNPSTGPITLNSKLLIPPGTQLKLYSLDGRLLRSTEILISGCDELELDLNGLNQQCIYVLLENGSLQEGGILSILP